MAKPKYNWQMARRNLAMANLEVLAAQRHCQYGKRVNVLNDLIALEDSIRACRFHLGAGDPLPIEAEGRDAE